MADMAKGKWDSVKYIPDFCAGAAGGSSLCEIRISRGPACNRLLVYHLRTLADPTLTSAVHGSVCNKSIHAQNTPVAREKNGRRRVLSRRPQTAGTGRASHGPVHARRGSEPASICSCRRPRKCPLVCEWRLVCRASGKHRAAQLHALRARRSSGKGRSDVACGC